MERDLFATLNYPRVAWISIAGLDAAEYPVVFRVYPGVSTTWVLAYGQLGTSCSMTFIFWWPAVKLPTYDSKPAGGVLSQIRWQTDSSMFPVHIQTWPVHPCFVVPVSLNFCGTHPYYPRFNSRQELTGFFLLGKEMYCCKVPHQWWFVMLQAPKFPTCRMQHDTSGNFSAISPALPFDKLLHNYGESPCYWWVNHGKSTISMAIFNGKL